MHEFSKTYDEVLLVHSVLNRLGGGKVDSFTDRLMSQKIHYLAQACGISPAYSYNLYLRGPYSPALANDLFAIKEAGISGDKTKFIPDELNKKFENLYNVIKGKNPRDLEVAITLHWFLKVVQLKKENAISNTQKYKEASYIEIKKSLNLIESLGL